MNIQPINSKKTMLNENDIVIVAAHESDLSSVQAAAKKHGISPERLMFTAYAKLLQNPKLVLLRAGNTLFSITAAENRVGVVMIFNGDVEENYVANFTEFLPAAHRVGFNFLAINDTSQVFKKHIKEIGELTNDASFTQDSDTGLIIIEFQEPHGD
jgi:hypothetical protein